MPDATAVVPSLPGRAGALPLPEGGGAPAAAEVAVGIAVGIAGGAAAAADAEGVAAQVRRTLRLSMIEGGLVQVFLNWTSGAVLTGYLLHLGATPMHLGLVASVPLLAQVMTPFAVHLASVVGRRRLLVATFAALGRGLWLLAALLPQLPVAPAARPALLVALVLVSSVFLAANGTLWAAWMGDVVPETHRGRYFGLRTGVVGLVGTAATLLAGVLLDRLAAPVSFQLVLLLALLCGGVGVWLYFGHYDPPLPPQRRPLLATLRVPLADANFRRFLRFGVYWQFVVLLAAPFVIPFFLQELGLSFTQVALWGAVAALTALLTTAGWGRVADRVGNKAVLAVGTFVAGLALPLCWILADVSGWTGWVWISAVFDALAWGAIGPAIFNLALASAPRDDRAAFFAMQGMVTGLAGFCGGMLSGPLLMLLRPFELGFGEVHWTAYHTLFAISGLLRMQAWRLLRPVEETNAWRTRELLRAMRTHWRSLGFFWRG